MGSQESVRVALLGAGERGQLMFCLFAKSVQRAHETTEVLTPASDTLYSHLLCFAAEEARIHGTVVDLSDFRQGAEKAAGSL
jgi:hypothetical protein